MLSQIAADKPHGRTYAATRQKHESIHFETHLGGTQSSKFAQSDILLGTNDDSKTSYFEQSSMTFSTRRNFEFWRMVRLLAIVPLIGVNRSVIFAQ